MYKIKNEEFLKRRLGLIKNFREDYKSFPDLPRTLDSVAMSILKHRGFDHLTDDDFRKKAEIYVHDIEEVHKHCLKVDANIKEGEVENLEYDYFNGDVCEDVYRDACIDYAELTSEIEDIERARDGFFRLYPVHLRLSDDESLGTWAPEVQNAK